MIALDVAEIARIVGGEVVGDASVVVDGPVSTDSRELGAGGLFVAKPGAETDGHRFVDAAVGAGAVAAIVEHPTVERVPQIVVPDAVAALGALGAAVVARVRAAGGLRVVAVTGSNGKTTTKNLLREIFSAEGATVAPRGSYNNEVGAPTTMLEITSGTRFLVLEMGASGVGAIRALTDLVRPDIGVVLTVGLAHAGEFGGIDRTELAKGEMVEALTADGTAVLNADDPRVTRMADRTAAGVLRFGRSSAADVRAEDVETDLSGTRFALVLPTGERFPVHFRVLGEHHVHNALAAATAALRLGVAPERIVAAIERVVRAERWRMEVLTTAPITVVNDAYNASPDSVAAALRTLATIAEGRRTVAVLGAMSELGEYDGEEHDRIGLQAVRLNIDQLVVVGDAARRIHIAAEREGSWSGESRFVATQDEALDALRGFLEPGDIVLVKSSNSVGLRFLGDRLAEAVRDGSIPDGAPRGASGMED